MATIIVFMQDVPQINSLAQQCNGLYSAQPRQGYELYVVTTPHHSKLPRVSVSLQNGQLHLINPEVCQPIPVPNSPGDRTLLIIQHFGQGRTLSFGNNIHMGTPDTVIVISQQPCIGVVGTHEAGDITRAMFDPDQAAGAWDDLQRYLEALNC